MLRKIFNKKKRESCNPLKSLEKELIERSKGMYGHYGVAIDVGGYDIRVRENSVGYYKPGAWGETDLEDAEPEDINWFAQNMDRIFNAIDKEREKRKKEDETYRTQRCKGLNNLKDKLDERLRKNI